MTPQERDLITTLLDRLKSAATQPKDPDAEALIRQAVVQQPDMPYYLVQTVVIQDLALHNAQDRIADLERQVAEGRQSSGGTFLGKLFGGSQSAPPPAPSGGPWARGPNVAPPQSGPAYGQGGYAPQPGYPPQPGYAPQPGYGAPAGGMMGGMGNMLGGGAGGGGFLRSAAATAAGVAGGALLFEGISSMFGHGYANSLSGGMSPGLGETVINNYYGDSGPGGGDYAGSVGGDYGGGGGGGDYSGDVGGDFGGGGDYDGGGDTGGDFGGGGDVNC